MIYAKSDFSPRHLVTAGNLGFVANNTPIYKIVKKRNKFAKYYNIAPGQIAMWVEQNNGSIPNAVAPANLTASMLPHLTIAVGVSTKGNGITDAVRRLTPGDLEGCTIDMLDAVAPQCSVPHIRAIYPECVSCDTITAKVRIYDNDSISFSENALKAYHEFTASYTPDCNTCVGCETEVTCDEVVCGLVDALNNDTDFTINGEPYPHYYNTGVERPYKAFKLWNTWKSYCITPEVGDGCTNCNAISALTTFTIDGAENIPFNLKDPGNNAKTLIDQLEIAVEMINEAFETETGKHSGFAFLSRGNGKCCPVQLFVTTCNENFAIAGLSECSDAIDQFPDFVTSGTCKQCGTNETTETPSCGIGIFTRPDLEDCNCWELNSPKQFTDRWIMGFDIISGSGNDRTPKYSKQAELLSPQRASGFGSQIQYLEYSQNIDAIGEEGFDYDFGNDTEGWLDLPRKTSRLRNAVTAKCDTSYCSYFLQSRATAEYGFTRTPINKLIHSYIHVPSNDSTTKAAVEALFTKLVTIVPQTCSVLNNATCS